MTSIGTTRKKPELSHRERVRLALERKPTDRPPIAVACAELSPAAYEDFDSYLRKNLNTTAEQYLDPILDMHDFRPRYIGPPLEPGRDIWGVGRKTVRYGRVEELVLDYHPLAGARTVDDILAHPWPSPDWFDYGSIPAQLDGINRGEEYCIYTLIGNLWEKSYYMRGMEQLMMDLVLNPELVQAIMGKVTGFVLEHTRRVLEAADGRLDVVFTADDMGTQEGLLMSVEMWREFIRPWHVLQNGLIHGFGCRVMYHSDGAVMELVPHLIGMGIDILQALQFDARGMDPARLKDDYGDRLCFEGGVSVQRTLPFGTAEDVRREVTSLLTTLGRDGGYIVGPSHEVPAGTPPENILAMFETARGYRV